MAGQEDGDLLAEDVRDTGKEWAVSRSIVVQLVHRDSVQLHVRRDSENLCSRQLMAMLTDDQTNQLTLGRELNHEDLLDLLRMGVLRREIGVLPVISSRPELAAILQLTHEECVKIGPVPHTNALSDLPVARLLVAREEPVGRGRLGDAKLLIEAGDEAVLE